MTYLRALKSQYRCQYWYRPMNFMIYIINTTVNISHNDPDIGQYYRVNIVLGISKSDMILLI